MAGSSPAQKRTGSIRKAAGLSQHIAQSQSSAAGPANVNDSQSFSFFSFALKIRGGKDQLLLIHAVDLIPLGKEKIL